MAVDDHAQTESSEPSSSLHPRHPRTVSGGQGRYAQLDDVPISVAPQGVTASQNPPVSVPSVLPSWQAVDSTPQAVVESGPQAQDCSGQLPTSGPQLDPRVESFLAQASQLADKYWNGSQSLLKNDRFKGDCYK